MLKPKQVRYNKKRDKAFANLINILDGIACDGIINYKEILFLDTWLLETEEISDNYCVHALRHRVSSILSDNIIDEIKIKSLKDDLFKIQKDLIDLPYINLNSIESDKHLLEGLCKGILADGKLNDAEINYLKWFLSANSGLRKNYPGKEIYSLIENILHDGVITEDEREFLRQTLILYTGCDIDSGIVDGLATQLPIDNIDSLSLDGATVCLTGQFLYGKRSLCEEELRQQGAVIVSKVTQQLDYLIVGTLSSKDWQYKSYGRKIEKAISYRDEKGISLKIISEEQWKSLS